MLPLGILYESWGHGGWGIMVSKHRRVHGRKQFRLVSFSGLAWKVSGNQIHANFHKYRWFTVNIGVRHGIICQAAIFEIASKATTTPVAPTVSRVFAFLMQAEQSIAVDQKSPGGSDSPQGLILFESSRRSSRMRSGQRHQSCRF